MEQTTDWKVIAASATYSVSNTGEVRNNKTGRLLRKNTIRNYFSVGLYVEISVQKIFRIHRLVAMAFIENPENKPYVNHKNGDKLDNRVSNLEWVTASENVLHAYRTRLHPPRDGQRNPNYKNGNWIGRAARAKSANLLKISTNKQAAI